MHEFTYAASHDLKEPIRKISTFINQLRNILESRLEEREMAIFERVQNSTARMIQLVDDLLEFSHITINPQKFEKIDLNQKVNKVLDDLDFVIQEKGARVTVEKLPTITGNRRQIEQMFQNLLSNALKYCKSDTPPHVLITSSEVAGKDIEFGLPLELLNNRYYRIDVKDNGIGFEQKYADKIFQVFQRLHGRSEYQGTGVGLAIVKKVVQNHRGFITAESEPGIGSTFKLFLLIED